MTQKKIFYPVLLTGLFITFILLTIPAGALYGSHTDWLSQHVRIAETIRSACLEQRTLTPAFLPLGGGSNGYQFSYYGYLRPDILIGCLLPRVPMISLMIGYMLAGYLSSVLLCYAWLTARSPDQQEEKEILPFPAFIGSLLFMTAACFFHTHRQIMFVNYMPFLMLSLLAVKKRRFGFLPLTLFFLYVNSFYYSIACLAVIGWYWLRQEGGGFWKRGAVCYLKSVFLSIGMAAPLLLPTALVILEHRRALEPFSLKEILGTTENLSGLLYSPYGMGLTFICLYFLLLGLGYKKYRMDSLFLLVISTWCFASWILNGTLYTRTKILIPFVPLVILQSTKILQALTTNVSGPTRDRVPCWRLWPCILTALSIPLWITSTEAAHITADLGIVTLVVLLYMFMHTFWYKRNSRKNMERFFSPLLCLLLCIMPCLLFLQTMQKDNFVKKQEAAVPDIFIKEDQTTGVNPKVSPLYRSESLIHVLDTCNLVTEKGVQKGAMYSSITNKEYASVYYDTFLAPIQINNSLALLPSRDPFLLNFLGVQYLQTTKEHLPCGYQVVSAAKKASGSTDIVLAQNRNVLPIAYVTDEIMKESRFLKLDRYERLDAATRYTIVPDTGSNSASARIPDARSAYVSHMQRYSPDFQDTDLPDTIHISRTDRGWQLEAEKKTNVTFPLKQALKGKILLLDFQVVNQSKKAVVIDINGMRNKLSGASAPYPNGNDTFHYQFSDSSWKGIDSLEVTFSKGTYLIQNIDWHTYDEQLLSRKQYTSVAARKTKGSEILSCTADAAADGYFVTSIPLQKGMEIIVDGKNVPIIKVNQAFAGTTLKKGKHDIRILFHAPGQKAGYWISTLSLFAWLFLIGRSKRKNLAVSHPKV